MSSPASGRRETPDDVGTLWTLQRSGHKARCALMALVGQWEPRILVDGHIILAERCPRGAGAFALADLWKRRMLADGWREVAPPVPPDPAVAKQDRAETELTPSLAGRFL
jgi:hypothetical protein